MNAYVTSLVLALSSPALAFQPSALSNRPSVALQNTLRDMASYADEQKYTSEFGQFDRNGAFSGSPQGGMDGRPEMMYGDGPGGHGGNPNPFARRGNPNDRMYTQDGFDPYSAYGSQFGMSQSDNRRGGGGPGGPQGMGHYGGPGMMGGGMNGVHNDNTLEGFSYSSRTRGQGSVREQQGQMGYGGGPQQQGQMGYGGGPQQQGQMGYGGEPPMYDYQGGMGGGFDPRFDDGPMMGGGMEYEEFGYPEGPHGFGGFDGDDMDLSRMGP